MGFLYGDPGADRGQYVAAALLYSYAELRDTTLAFKLTTFDTSEPIISGR